MSIEPRPESFFLDHTVKNASIILWPWTIDADDFAFPDRVEADRKFFTENPHRIYRLRFASQLECAMWSQKTGKDIPEDSFLYVAIRCRNQATQCATELGSDAAQSMNKILMPVGESFSKEASNDRQRG